MPRQRFFKEQYMLSDLSKLIMEKLYEHSITKKRLAEAIGVSNVVITNKINKGIFSRKELVTLFDFLQFSDDEVLKVMQKERRTA